MLKLKEIKMSDVPKRTGAAYGGRIAFVDEFMKSNMQACLVEIGNDESTSARSIAASLRKGSKSLGYSDKLSIYERKGKIYMIKKGEEAEGTDK